MVYSMHSPPCPNRHIAIVLQHGWGFHNKCFEVLARHLQALGSVISLDRGYFGNPSSFPVYQRVDTCTLVVCHSLGLHYFTPAQLSRIDLLVVVSGFAFFHGMNLVDGVFSRKHIRRMRGRLQDDPVQLVREFYRDCSWHGDEPDFGALNDTLLADDLDILDSSDFSHAALFRDKDILLLHGADDRIVPLSRARELNSRFEGSQLNVVDGAGHGLPFTHAEKCAHCIEAFVSKVSSSHENSCL